MKHNHILKSTLLFVLTLSLVFCLVGCGDVKTKNGVIIKKDATPAEFLEAVAQNTRLEYIDAEDEQTINLLSKVCKGGAVSLATEIPEVGDVELYLIPNSDGVFSLSAKAADLAQINAFGSADEFAVKANISQEGVSSSVAYGISLKDFNENLNKSIFAPGSDSDYAIPQEVADLVNSVLDMFGKDKVDAVLADLEKTLFSVLEELSAKFPLEKIDNEDKTFSVKTTVTEKAFTEWFRSSLEKVQNTPSVSDFIKELEKLFDEEIPDLVESFDEAMEGEDLGDDTLQFEIHVTEDYLIDRVTVSENSDNEIVFTLNKTENGINVGETVKLDGETHSLTAVVTEEADGAMKVNCTLKEDGEEEQTAAFVWNRKTDKTFTFTAADETITGTIDVGAERAEVSIDLPDGSQVPSITLSLFSKADTAKAPTFEYQDILKMDPDTLESILSALPEILGMTEDYEPDDVEYQEIEDPDWPIGDDTEPPFELIYSYGCYYPEYAYCEYEFDYEYVTYEDALAYVGLLEDKGFIILEDQTETDDTKNYQFSLETEDGSVSIQVGGIGDEEDYGPLTYIFIAGEEDTVRF